MRRRTATTRFAVLLTMCAGPAVACGRDGAKAPTAARGCETATPAPPKSMSFDAAPPLASSKKSWTITFDTSCGAIAAKLLAKEAPATVAAFDFLAGKRYFDGTYCHRATQTASLTVLQCGDPTGTGGGGPGFTVPEENLPKPDKDRFASYPRGTLAMARTRDPHSGGSQFFLVVRDSTLPPDYTIFGVVTSGVEVLDEVLAGGIDDADGDTGAGLDGAPRKKIFLKTVRVSAK
jgi:peptidyl-prolyl cis-trans isomerase B (cyclophilin B)